MTARPHDALFKSAFEAPAAATALLRALLPAAVRETIAWDSLGAETGSFIDSALADRHSDLLFSARLRTGEPALLYVLLEHQSTGDAEMPLRGLSYQVRIWERFLKRHPRAWLPPILTVVVSHVRGGWRTSRSLEDMLAPAVRAMPGLVALMPRFSLLIDDLAHLSDAELHARSLAAFQKLALWLLRDARDPVRLLSSFERWAAAMLELLEGPGGFASFATLVAYMFRVVDPVHRETLRAKIKPLGPRAEEVIMTIAEQLIEEGREQGLEKGREQGLEKGLEQGLETGRLEGRIATLRSLLRFKFKLQTLEPVYEARLLAAPPSVLDRYLERVLTAESIAAVFED
ncbi:MAG TPA: Rpn family recombination-promoting nuclease/putative transposase [Kofleriaceae bacterium]|jgi:hypothetical protein|nr:Rpn family recombination-promoting nuclease/putative transposase [Kofleriaceae bacterium]